MDQPQNTPRENELIKYISKYIDLTDTEINTILKDLDIQHYKKGDILIKEGEVPELCYFIFKGCVRQYYNIDGEERTTDFYTEGQSIAVFQGTNSNKKSPYYLSCLEDCEMSVGPIIPQRSDLDPRFITLCKTAAEDELYRAQETLSMYRLTNPEERYIALMKTNPKLIERVPQYYLASYLGIKPESLSRIRKRLTKKV